MSVVPEQRIDTTPVDTADAAEIEAAEARAWTDLYGAAPAEWAAEVGLSVREVAGATVVSWAATGRRYFSRPIGLGVVSPATPAALDDLLVGYARAGIAMFLIPSQPHCLPVEYEQLLRERGLEPFDSQDRVVRGGEPMVTPTLPPEDRELVVERVRDETADEWAEFLQRVYRLDTGAWLQGLIGRTGWHQYVVREAGVVVAARGMRIGPDRSAWLGMDGPVPGLMTPDYAPDAALCAAIVADGLSRGVRLFLADIEAPSATQETPAYGYFGGLGFRRPYARTHWTLA